MTLDPSWVDYNGHLNQAYYGVLFDRALNLRPRGVTLAGFDQGESVLGVEPPVIAIGLGDAVEQGNLFGFASWTARKSDQAEDR